MDDRLLVGANWDVWVTKNEAVRAPWPRCCMRAPDEIAVTASASAGLNALASALDFTGPRNKVVVSDFEFPTNAQIWHAQEPRGARIVHVPRAADGYIPLRAFAAAIDARDAAGRRDPCVLPQRRAARHPRHRPPGARAGRARAARLLPGGRRADVDVQQLDVDFAVGGMLKYLLGTAGIGFLYVRGSLHRDPRCRPTRGWFAQEEIFAMDITANRPSPNARRFEAGTPAVVNCYAAEAGLEIMLGVGTPRSRARPRAHPPLHAAARGDRLGERDARRG